MKKQAKPVSAATRAMLDAMTADAQRPPSPDKLVECRKKVAELRDLEVEKQQLAERMTAVNKDIERLKWQDIVNIFQETGIDSLGVPASGNLPAFDVALDDHYHANIPKDNESQAFAYLNKKGMGDMVKTTFTVSFGLGEGRECVSFEEKLSKLCEKLDEPYEKKQSVPWNTLTAYIKGEFKAGRPIAAKVLGMLGATVGRVAVVKKQKKEK